MRPIRADVRTVFVIGIGAGDPEHLTLQAIAAMNRVDVFFTVDKGPATEDLSRLRGEWAVNMITCVKCVSLSVAIASRRAGRSASGILPRITICGR